MINFTSKKTVVNEEYAKQNNLFKSLIGELG